MLRRGYNPLTAYKQSKLCNILFAKGLNDRYPATGPRAYVVDPGLVNTDIGNKKTGGLVNFIWTFRKRRGVAPSVPAKTYAYLCGQKEYPQGLYYYLCRENTYGKHVTSKNADRLFKLSERLCGIRYGGEAAI
jgi:NAD(P)-dependent dehydrogenase (short-subunit alcohol dehydrogenase family)